MAMDERLNIVSKGFEVEEAIFIYYGPNCNSDEKTKPFSSYSSYYPVMRRRSSVVTSTMASSKYVTRLLTDHGRFALC